MNSLDPQKSTQDLNDLRQKYDSVIKKLDSIEKENSTKDLSIKRIEKTSKASFSFMNMMTRPLKKVTISAMSSLFTIADYASEKAACARESMEDIIAEAQYQSRKKQAAMMTPPMLPDKQC